MNWQRALKSRLNHAKSWKSHLTSSEINPELKGKTLEIAMNLGGEGWGESLGYSAVISPGSGNGRHPSP